MFDGFKKFILKGNVADMATGIMIGAAFTALVKSFVSDILAPPLGILINNIDFSDLFIVLKKGAPLPPYATLEAATAAGAVTLNYGLFINAFISFLITGAFLYFLIHKLMHLHDENVAEQEAASKADKDATEAMQKEHIKVLVEIRDALKG